MHSITSQIVRWLILKPIFLLMSGVLTVIAGIITFKFVCWLIAWKFKQIERANAREEALRYGPNQKTH